MEKKEYTLNVSVSSGLILPDADDSLDTQTLQEFDTCSILTQKADVLLLSYVLQVLTVDVQFCPLTQVESLQRILTINEKQSMILDFLHNVTSHYAQTSGIVVLAPSTLNIRKVSNLYTDNIPLIMQSFQFCYQTIFHFLKANTNISCNADTGKCGRLHRLLCLART